jgi:hypothetical protein
VTSYVSPTRDDLRSGSTNLTHWAAGGRLSSSAPPNEGDTFLRRGGLREGRRRGAEILEARSFRRVPLKHIAHPPERNSGRVEELPLRVPLLLRKIGARTKEALIEAMGRALAAVSAEDVRGFFVNCGYRAPLEQQL